MTSKKEKLAALLDGMSPEDIAELILDREEKKTEDKPKKRTQSRKKNVAEEEEVVPKQKSGKSSRPRRIAKAGERTQKVRKGGSGKGMQSMGQSVDVSGGRVLNKQTFVSQTLREHRTDKELAAAAEDKETWNPQPRRGEAKNIEIDCNVCGDLWAVPESRVYKDDNGIVFKCDTCLKRNRPG
jgi:hypothetical protein